MKHVNIIFQNIFISHTTEFHSKPYQVAFRFLFQKQVKKYFSHLYIYIYIYIYIQAKKFISTDFSIFSFASFVIQAPEQLIKKASNVDIYE